METKLTICEGCTLFTRQLTCRGCEDGACQRGKCSAPCDHDDACRRAYELGKRERG